MVVPIRLANSTCAGLLIGLPAAVRVWDIAPDNTRTCATLTAAMATPPRLEDVLSELAAERRRSAALRERERAVRAALALTAAVGRIATPAGTALAVRVGIATGPVMVGDLMGAEEARERAVVGETPNLAARLQALAEPGGVVVAEGTRRLLGGLFELATWGREPARASRSRYAPGRPGEGAAEGRFEALHGGPPHAAGRPRARAGAAARPLGAGQGGRGQVVLLSGEAGIGKSRLVRALRERLGGEPHTPLSQFCSPYHTNTALHPVIGLLERAAGLDRDQPPERQLDKLEACSPAPRPMRRRASRCSPTCSAYRRADRYPPWTSARGKRRSGRSGCCSTSSRGWRRRGRCWRSTRTCTGPTRPRWS